MIIDLMRLSKPVGVVSIIYGGVRYIEMVNVEGELLVVSHIPLRANILGARLRLDLIILLCLVVSYFVVLRRFSSTCNNLAILRRSLIIALAGARSMHW